MNIFNWKRKSQKKPSPLLEEMQAVNQNLEAIQALLASQKPPQVTVTTGSAQPAQDFEPFEPFDSGEDTAQ